MYNYYSDNGVIYNGLFKLASGKYSDVYFNKNIITTLPYVFAKTVNMMLKRMPKTPIDCITGPATAGIVFGTAVAAKLLLPFVYPDKTEDDQQIFKRGYDHFLADKNVIIIEDVITTGGSVNKVVQSVNEAGGTVKGIICIWNREEYSSSKFPVYSIIINQTVKSWEEKEIPKYLKSVLPRDPKTLL